MLAEIFREYDIRGIVGEELLIDRVYDLGRAIATYLIQRNPRMRNVAVGMDGRVHSQAIREQLVRAFADSGFDVTKIGVCTSPVIYFAMHTRHFDAGVMITASHNPKEYNGFKINLGKSSLWGDDIRAIRDIFFAGNYLNVPEEGIINEEDIKTPYVTWLANNFAHLKGKSVKCVMDCGNGAAGSVVPQLVAAMNWSDIELLYADIDGTYPHHEADPTVEKNMLDVRAMLKSTPYTLGIGFDGDCDRVGAMTKEGVLVPGDQLLALFALSIAKKESDLSVVCDIKSSGALLDILAQNNIKAVMSPAGHSIVKQAMRREGALLGGEMSGHFCFKDRFFGFDDGLYAALRIIEMLLESGESLSDALRVIPVKKSSPEYRMPWAEHSKHEAIDAVKKFYAPRTDCTLITIDGVRVQTPYGWGLVRASNTQPKITLRFESDTDEGLLKLKHEFYELLKPLTDESVVREYLEL